jgi:glycerol uptake facilitator-like aquaporin
VTSASDESHGLGRRVAAEALGTALLLAVVVGSGIMAQRLSSGNAGVALLANTLATVAGLYVLIEVFGPISGAHFNPAVSGVLVLRGRFSRSDLPHYVVAQMVGAASGAWLANAMFDLPVLQLSNHVRSGAGIWLGEVVATAGLVLVVLRSNPSRVAGLVALYIGTAYWFTSSTSFANPAAVIGRMLSDTFTGIAPGSAPGFVIAEMLGSAVALAIDRSFGHRAA